MNTPIRILIVDDEMGIRAGCKRALTSKNFIIDEAEDGESGLKKIQHDAYDLVLVDLMMPGISGLDLLPKIKQIDPEIIMIVITGYATIETAVEATKKGAYDYLSKPFTPDALISIVSRGLEKRQLSLQAIRLQEEREQRLLELAGEKSKLKTIISCMADGVIVTNLEGQLVLWNASLEKMFKSKAFDKTGRPLDNYIKNKTLLESIQAILIKNNKNLSMISKEIEIEEHGIILMANIAPVLDENDIILGSITVLRDISKLKEIEKIKSQFVSMVAHELRAPLAAIKGWLEIIVSGAAGSDEEQNKKWLLRAKDRSDSLLSLVSDLLEINRMEAGKIAQKMEVLHLEEIVKKIVDFLKPGIDSKKINIDIQFSKNFPAIQADKKDMEKLFTNLINNAIKYNVENGKIIIQGEAINNEICLQFKDTGIGISEENLRHLFEDFFRADDYRIKKIPGTGLGLTIAKRIVDSHFGRIDVQSKINKGSTFCIYLPIKKETK